MKQSSKADSEKIKNKYSAVKAAVALCAALVVVVGGTFAVYGSSIGSNESIKAADIACKVRTETSVSSEDEPAPEAADDKAVPAFSLSDMRKADMAAYEEGYSSAEADKATTTTTKTAAEEKLPAEETAPAATTTKAAVTTTRKTTTEAPQKVPVEQPKAENTTTTKAEVKFNNFSSPKTMYVTMEVNFRKGPDTSYDKYGVLSKNTEVKAKGISADGKWYSVDADGKSGYIMASYLSENKAVTTTARAAATTTTAARTPDVSGEGAVISYNAVDFEMMTYVVQSEVGNCDEKSKLAVCNVMINRVKSDQFPNTLSEILTQKNQFTAVSHYFNRTNPPNQNTIDCCYRALHGEGAWIVNGATFYYTPKYSSPKASAWFESLCLCASFDGQRFFKNW